MRYLGLVLLLSMGLFSNVWARETTYAQAPWEKERGYYFLSKDTKEYFAGAGSGKTNLLLNILIMMV